MMLLAKKTIFGCWVALWVLLLSAGFAMAQQKTKADAERFINDLSVEVIALVTADIPDAEYKKHMAKLVDDHAEYDRLVAFVLGQYNRQISNAERAKFKSALIEYFHLFFANQFKTYNGQKTVVESVVKGNNNIFTMKVNFVPTVNTEPTLRTEWRLWWNNGFKVMDITVNNVSMVAILRAEVVSILNQSGGNVDVLADKLRARSGEAFIK